MFYCATKRWKLGSGGYVSGYYFSERFSAVSGAADYGPVHPALVRRRSGGLEQLPAVLSGGLAGRIRLCALAGFAPRCAAASCVHIALLLGSLLFLPIGPNAAFWKPDSSDNPSGRILLCSPRPSADPTCCCRQLARSCSAGSPWPRPGKSPWRLYALSNLGSFLALLSYPFAIEPFLRLPRRPGPGRFCTQHSRFCAAGRRWRMRSGRPPAIRDAGDKRAAPDNTTALFWLALSTCSSTLLVATTNQLSQDIAVNPFLWVAALSIYLLTFILAFQSERAISRVYLRLPPDLLAPIGCVVPSLTGTLSLAVAAGALLVAYSSRACFAMANWRGRGPPRAI